MTLILPQSADGEVISVAAGTHVGTVLLRKHDVTFRGAGVDVTTLRADGQINSLFAPAFPPLTPDGQPIRSVTIEDMTLDADGIDLLTSVVRASALAGPLQVNLSRIKIVGNARTCLGVSLDGVSGTLSDVQVYGDGISFKALNGCSNVTISNSVIRGGYGGLIADDTTGLIVNGLDMRLWYWANHGVEVALTDVEAYAIEVEENPLDGRDLYDVIRMLVVRTTLDASELDEMHARRDGIEVWDRLEHEDGRWTQVLKTNRRTGAVTLDTWRGEETWTPAATPDAGLVTVYRVVIGRTLGVTGNRIQVYAGNTPGVTPPNPHWRDVWGEVVAAPSLAQVARCDIIRCATNGGDRDTDVGGIHLLDGVSGSTLTDVYAEGTWSDSLTDRGGNTWRRCAARLNQDMTWTIEGNSTLIGCTAERAGFSGFYIHSGSPTLTRCHAGLNGTQRYGTIATGWGVTARFGATPTLRYMSFHRNIAGNIRRATS